MAGSYIVHFVVIICLVVLPTISKGSHPWNVLNGASVFHKPCNSRLAFSVTFGETTEKCLFDCKHRLNCKLLMFHHRMKQCALLEADVDDIDRSASEETCLYSDVKSSESETNTASAVCNATERFDTIIGRCVLSECNKPSDIKNAIFLSTTHKIESVGRYICKFGYFGIGNPAVLCQTNGTWTHTNFTCNISNCPFPEIVTNSKLISANTKVGSTVHYECIDNHLLFGKPTIFCQMNATWTPSNFTCAYAYCPTPTSIANSYLQSAQTLLGTGNRYLCVQGYYGVGNQFIFCNLSAAWNSTNFVCEKFCSTPRLFPYARLVSLEYPDNETSLKINTKIKYECDTYSYTSTHVCVSGGYWQSRQLPCCKNGTVIYGSRCVQVFTSANVTTFQAAYQKCRSAGMYLQPMTRHLYDWLQTKEAGPSKWMLYYSTKTALRNGLVYYCLNLQVNLTSLELLPFKNASYDDVRSEILEKGWDKMYQYCRYYLVSTWLDGQPDGQESEDCIVNGPDSGFRYIDVACDISDNIDFGFACKYFQPYV